MRAKKNVFVNPCEEKWESMSGDKRRRMCAICKKNVHDVSQLELEAISSDYINSEKCVRMNTDQIQFFQFFRSMSRAAGLTAALSFLPIASVQAQDQDSNTKYCIVSGKIKSNVVSYRQVFVVVNGRKIETRSENDGTFKIMVPKGEKIQYSNIRKLNNKTLKEDVVSVRKVRMPKLSTFIGTPSF